MFISTQVAADEGLCELNQQTMTLADILRSHLQQPQVAPPRPIVPPNVQTAHCPIAPPIGGRSCPSTTLS